MSVLSMLEGGLVAGYWLSSYVIDQHKADHAARDALRCAELCCAVLCRPQDFTDWRVLQQQFGLHSFAAVPLMVAGTVHGVILAAAAAPHTFTKRWMSIWSLYPQHCCSRVFCSVAYRTVAFLKRAYMHVHEWSSTVAHASGQLTAPTQLVVY
jgi:hypothetical protein